MMFKYLLQFEWQFHSRQVSFFLALALFMFFGFMITGRLGYAGKVFVNSPYLVASVYLFIGSMIPIMISLFAANSVLRDDINKMTEMVYSSRLNVGQFIASRYFGLVLVALVVLVSTGLAMMLRTHLPQGIDGNFTQNTIANYVWILLVFLLPNVLLCAAISFAVTIFSRNIIATYLSGLGIYILMFLAAMFVGSPMFGGNLPMDPSMRHLAAIIDPLGISAFEVATEFWTAAEKNTQLISLEGDLLWNRLLWLIVTAFIMLTVYARFKLNLEFKLNHLFKLNHQFKSKSKQKLNSQNKKARLSAVNLSYQTVIASKQAKRHWLALRSRVSFEFGYLLKSYAFWVVVGLWTIFVMGEILPIVNAFEFSPPLYPMTSRILERFVYDLLPRFCLFVVIFYTADVVWREKELKMDAFIDASPTNSLVFFCSKLLALCLIPLFLISIAIILGLALQLSSGYYDFEPSLYLSVFYYGGLPLIISIAMCLFIQTLVANKYIGMLISTLILIFMGTNFSSVIGLEHDLWHFASAPSYRYSDMNGYAHINHTFATYMLYWGSLALLLCLLGFGLWRRGTDILMTNRIKQIKTQLGNSGLLSAAACLLVFISSGGYIFYQSNIAANYYSSADRELWRANYEIQFKSFENIAQPNILSIKTQVDLFPEKRRFEVVGEYQLINRQNVAVKELLISLDNDLDLTHLELLESNGEPVTLANAYPAMGNYHFKLNNLLAPGESLTLKFKFQQQQSGFGGFDNRALITDNATLLYSSNLFPRVGYIKQRELANNKIRAKYGLVALAETETLEESISRTQGDFSGQDDFVQFETIVSTKTGQIALAPGSLQKQWQDNGRVYFQYRSDSPIRNSLIYLSSDYAMVKDQMKDIALQIYYYPKHQVNLPRMMQGIKDSLSYQIANFGDYPHKIFKQIEVAEYTGITGFAAPSMTLMGEHSGFSYDLRDADNYDQVYRRSAHEVAHQWWGHKLAPADIDEGAMLLVEMLARYSESMIMKKVYGDQVALKFINFEMDRYFRGRARETDIEMPLYRNRVEQSYLIYSKGAVVMYALQNLIGETKVNLALNRLVKKHGYPQNPPTSLDLLDEFYQVAPEQITQIDEWFKQITYVEMQIENAKYQKLENGQYEIELEIPFVKKQVDELGNESELVSNQMIEIEIINNPNIEAEIQTVELRPGSNQIKLVTAKIPTEIKLDPRSLLLNKNRFQASKTMPN